MLYADLGFGPRQTDGLHESAAHVVGLRAEDMLAPRTPDFVRLLFWACSVSGLPLP